MTHSPSFSLVRFKSHPGTDSTGVDGGNHFIKWAKGQGLIETFKKWRTLIPIKTDIFAEYLDFMASPENTRVKSVSTFRKYMKNLKSIHDSFGMRSSWEETNSDEGISKKIILAEEGIERRVSSGKSSKEPIHRASRGSKVQKISDTEEEAAISDQETTVISTEVVKRESARIQKFRIEQQEIKSIDPKILSARLRVEELHGQIELNKLEYQHERYRMDFIKTLMESGKSLEQVSKILKMLKEE